MRGNCHRRWGTLFALLVALMLRPALAKADGYLLGKVSLEGTPDGVPLITTQPFTLEVSGGPIATGTNPTVGSGSVVAQTFTLRKSGDSFPMLTLPAGRYTVRIKGPLWLRTAVNNVIVTDGIYNNAPITLLAGDANNDDSVDSSDFTILIGAYNSRLDIPGSGYDYHADFNQDRSVDSSDFTLLIGNYNGVGVPYQVVIDTVTQNDAGRVVLTWHLIDATGATTPPPTGTTFSVFRSTTQNYAGSSRTAVIVSSPTYTDFLPNLGPNYYQIVANLPGSYGLSREALFLPSNPLIENRGGGVYRITGFKPDYSGLTYQAKVTNGLLNSYKVNNHELFHTNPATGATLPIQFAQYVPPYLANALNYRTLASGNYTHSSSSLSSSSSGTLTYSIAESNGLMTGITYTATPANLQMTLNPNYGLSFCLPLGSEHDTQENEAVFLAQNVASAGQGYLRYPGSGTTYALPLPANYSYYNSGYRGAPAYSVDAVRNLRCLFNDSSGVDVTYALNDPGYVEEQGHLLTGQTPSNSAVSYSCWGRDFGTGNIQFTFNPVGLSVNQTPNSAPPFHLFIGDSAANLPTKNIGSYDSLGLYAKTTYGSGIGGSATNQLYGQIQIDPSRVSGLSGDYTLTCVYTDFWGKTHPNAPASPSSVTVHASDFDSATGIAGFNLPLPNDGNIMAPLSGWFHLTASLAPAGTTGNLRPDQDSADFGVYNYTVSAPNIYNGPQVDASEAPLDDYPLSLGGVLGHSDPALPELLGSKTNRVDSNIVIGYDPTLYSYTAKGEKYYTHLMPRNEGSTKYLNAATISRVFDRFAQFTDVGGANPDQVTLVASVVPFNNAGASFGMADVAFTMAAALTAAQSGTGNNPIKYWSLGNEPRVYDPNAMQNYLRDSLYPARQAITTALSAPNNYHSDQVTTNQAGVGNITLVPGKSPVFLGPNIVSAELHIYGQGPLSWWDAFFAATYTDGTTIYPALHLLDAVATHTYTGDDRSWEEHGVSDTLKTLQDKIAAAPEGRDSRGNPKPLWITEHGWNWIDSADMPRLQAAYIVRRYALAAAQGIPHNQDIYYYAADIGYNYNFQYLWNKVPNRGAMALRVLNEKTVGMHYDKNLTLATGKYVHAVPYTDGQHETLVVWGNDFDDPQRTNANDIVKMPLISSNGYLAIYDIMGNDISVNYQPVYQNGAYTYSLPATGSPVYVVGSYGDTFSVGSGWPSLIGQTNYALIGTASALTTASDEANNPGVFLDPLDTDLSNPNNLYYNRYLNGKEIALNDGVWGYDDMQSNGLPDGKGNLTKAKRIWIGGQTYPTANPDWVKVTFPAKTINTLVAVVPSSNNAGGGTLCGVRDYRFQITTDGTNWTTVKTVTSNTTEWTLHATVPTNLQSGITGVRLIIDNVNNGRWYDDYSSYTDYNNAGQLRQVYGSPLRAMVYELEAYGP